jgi:hypothetical protein
MKKLLAWMTSYDPAENFRRKLSGTSQNVDISFLPGSKTNVSR